MFGGNTRNNQTLAQSFTQFNAAGAVLLTGTYNADTALRWSDVGARLGLDVKAPVTELLTVGIAGWVGGAGRSTSFSGSDSATDAAAQFTFGSSGSTISTSSSRAVFLANAEGGFAYQFSPTAAVRGFAGLNFDGSVPGIASPRYGGAGDQAVGPVTSRTPASIYYASETSYYAGGGLVVRFGR